jgi:hypothetical protein
MVLGKYMTWIRTRPRAKYKVPQAVLTAYAQTLEQQPNGIEPWPVHGSQGHTVRSSEQTAINARIRKTTTRTRL